MATHYVSPSGSATWAASTNIATPCSISTANANATAGDIVNLRGGTYYIGIIPTHSGTDMSNRVTFQNYAGETPTFTVNEAGGRWSVKLQGVSWIKVDGITSYHSGAFYRIGYGACYNEITNSYFSEDTNAEYSTALITWLSSAGAEGGGSDHNWIHHNTFSKYGWISTCDDKGTIRISANYNDPSSHNTFEDNVFSYGGHDLMDIGGWYNVARNNTFHNEEAWFADTAGTCENTPASGYFGNRCILLSNSGDNVGTANHTLIEGNRIGYAGTPPDDDGSSGIENAGAHTLARFNDIYGCFGMAYYSKMQPGGVYPSSLDSGSYARFYNNTLYKNGGTGPGTGKYEADLSFTTAITIWSYVTYNDWPRDIVIKNNIVYSNYAEFEVGTQNILPQITYTNNYTADPLFANPSLADKTSLTIPDFSLSSGSGCIGAGEHLTRANGAGTASTFLTVDDAYPFQDGTWGSDLSDIRADWIAIGSVTNVVEIEAINYTTKVITLATPMTWADDALIWLYKKSDGVRVLYGSAPEIGAHVYEGTGATDTNLSMNAAAIALASTTPTLSPAANTTLSVAASSIGSLADTFSITSVAGLPWFIRLGPEDHESTLPTLNWTAGVHTSPPVSSSAFVDKVVLLDGSVRYNHRSYAPKRWTLEWASLSEADALGIRNLIDINEPLHYQNTWINTTWHWVVFKSIQTTPLKANRERGDQLYRVVIELEEVV